MCQTINQPNAMLCPVWQGCMEPQCHHKKTYIKVIGQFNDKVTALVKDFAKAHDYKLRRDQGKRGIKVARAGMTQILPVSQKSCWLKQVTVLNACVLCRRGFRTGLVQYGIIINTAGQTHGNPEWHLGYKQCGSVKY
jgi:hypothetical protein